MLNQLNHLSQRLFNKDFKTLDNAEIFETLLTFTSEKIKQTPKVTGDKKLYYLSAEFLIGKLLSNNLINLGLYDKVDQILNDMDVKFSDIAELELEPSLGNGGLGRLAACFIDSISTLGLCGSGVGINYHYGLFEQRFKDNKQVEYKNEWLGGHNFLQDTERTFLVTFGHHKVDARLYTMAVTGYDSAYNDLYLFDIDTVDESLVKDTISFDKSNIEKNLTLFLYPDDSDDAGKKLRIYQQYFLVSAGAQMILSDVKAKGHSLEKLYDYAVIQINDTHPSMIIPELIRLLMAEGFDFDASLDIVTKTTAYTNHTILAEALEKWPYKRLQDVVPQLMPIIDKLDALVKEKFDDPRVGIILPTADLQSETNGNEFKKIEQDTSPETNGDKSKKIEQDTSHQNDRVHMAHMAIHYSKSVNGVAKLHTDILKSSELKPFYDIYPDKFNNKTNGITFRRWLMACNRELTAFIEARIGQGFKTDAMALERLMAYVNDDAALDELLDIKQSKKRELADYILKHEGVKIDSDSVFDIQIKRLHEYKRQQMNVLYIIDKYLEIKAGKLPIRPITVIFGAKAAPAYTIAKDIIHLILVLQKLIESDKEVSQHLKVVMVKNYNVTYAEKLIPACDISEQISLASKEASGTGNMKLMLNGAVTLGTLDGANVEIAELVGSDNIYIFGEASDDVIARYKRGDYVSKDYYDANPKLKEIVDFIISDDVVKLGCKESLNRLYDELLNKDWFMTFPDFKDYALTKNEALADYEDQNMWAKKMLVNIAKAGYFSSDRVIKDYNRDIWKL